MNEDKLKTNKSAVGILSLSHLLSDAYGGFIIPIMPVIAAKLNISLGLVGLLISISSVSASFLQPIFGFFSDRLTKRVFVIWGLIFSAVFISLTGLTDNIWLLALFIFLGNMGVGLYHPQASAMVAHFSGRRINSLMGFFTACGTIGYALGPFLSSSLVEHFGLSSTIWVLFPGLIIAYFTFVILPKVPIKAQKTRFKDLGKTLAPVKNILFVLAFISIIRAVTVFSFHVYMPFLWAKHNYSIVLTGTLLALSSFSGGISSFIGGHLTNYIGRRNIMILSLLPAIPCLFGSVYFLDSSPLIAKILFVLAGLALMSSTSVNLVIAQMAAPKNIGMVSGIVGGFSWGIAGLLLTPIGFLANDFGIVPILTTIAFVPILGVICSFFIPKEYA